MYTVEILIERGNRSNSEQIKYSLDDYIAALWRNGQILGTNGPIAQKAKSYLIFVNVPEQNSLNRRFQNKQVLNAIRGFRTVGLRTEISLYRA